MANPFTDVSYEELLKLHREEKAKTDIKIKELTSILVQTFINSESDGKNIYKYFTIGFVKDIKLHFEQRLAREKITLETAQEMLEIARNKTENSTNIEKWKTQRDRSNWRLKQIVEEQGYLDYLIDNWRRLVGESEMNPFRPTHALEGTLSRLLADEKELDRRDREIAKLSVLAEKCRLPVPVQHEKLEEIFSWQGDTFSEQTEGYSTPEFNRIKIAYVDKLFSKTQSQVAALFDKYAAFELGWSRFYDMLRKLYPDINDKHNEDTVPNLSEFFVITQRRTVITKQTMAHLHLKDLGRRRPSEDLPAAIKELSMELNELANQTQNVKGEICELKSQKELIEKLVKQEVSDYACRLFSLYQIDANFVTLDDALGQIGRVEMIWTKIQK